MDINRKEKEKLLELAKRHRGGSCFTGKDSADTYFIPRNSDVYCMEYGFESLPELKQQLKELWKDKDYMDDVIKIASIAAFKNRTVQSRSDAERENEDKEVLPAYIYNF